MKRWPAMKMLGFTLAEIMIVISILSALAIFSVRNFASETRNKLVDLSAAQVLDVKRAVVSHFVATGAWPDAANGCTGGARLLTPAIGVLRENPWGFPLTLSCPQVGVSRAVPQADGESIAEAVQTQPGFRIRQQVPTGAVARALANRLPSAQPHVEEGTDERAFFVDVFVPMALLPQSQQDISNQVVNSASGVDFRVITCAAGEVPRVILTPREMCSAAGLYGYRLFWTPARQSDGDLSSSIARVTFQVLNPNGEWSVDFPTCNGASPAESVGIFQYCEAVAL